jgi:hypothetical protein
LSDHLPPESVITFDRNTQRRIGKPIEVAYGELFLASGNKTSFSTMPI